VADPCIFAASAREDRPTLGHRLVHNATILEMNVDKLSKKRGDRHRPRSRTFANARDNQSIVLIVAPRRINYAATK
jgi:hypothetical protein